MADDLVIPKSEVGRVMGLLEVLDDYGGRIDIAKVAADLLFDLDDILPVVDTAELLAFAKVVDGDVMLTKRGFQFVSQGIRGRKKIIQDRLKGLDLFKMINKEIRSSEDGTLEKEELFSFLRTLVPEKEVERLFKVIVEWGRHGLMLRYDSEDEKVRLIQ